MNLFSGGGKWVAVALVAGMGGPGGHAGAERVDCREARADFPAAKPAAGSRHYAPDWRVDLRHLILDVTPDFARRTVRGTATWRLAPFAEPVRELRLDAVDLTISNVTATAALKSWQVEPDAVRLTFDPPLSPEHEVEIRLRFFAEPRGGMYFRTPELGYSAEDTHLFTQGEAQWARHWYPCFDAPNERFTSEIICHAPADMVVLSNGRLLGREVDARSGLATVHWAQELPHANYLIALVVGRFAALTNHWRDVPLSFYVPQSEAALAENSFRDTPDIMAFYEKEIGVRYPWARYAQVCVRDFVAGGMENTSLTILGDRTLFPAATGTLHSSRELVAHEMAHQWFGDYVTCKDWCHLWLNEGFATYYENLYEGHKEGRDEFLYQMYRDARSVLMHPDDQTPIVTRTYAKPDDLFGWRVYPKGAWVLHMLRCQLGEALYRRAIRTYLERHALGVVTTDDLQRAFEAVSGRELDAFFDQWVYHAGTPVLDVSYQWDAPNRQARIRVRQTQKTSARVLLFRFPLTFRFQGRDYTEDREVTIHQAAEDFAFSLPAAPRRVRVDPEYTLLAQIHFTPPRPMLLAQLDDSTDMLGRLFAVRTLARGEDAATVERLGRVLREDSFYGVRLAASQALRRIHNEAALTALLAGWRQADDRVARQVLRDLRGFYSDRILAVLREVIAHTPNPELRAEAVQGWEAHVTPESEILLRRMLRLSSFHNVVANAAIQTLRAQDDPASVAPLLAVLKERRAAFRARDYAVALRALAFLARRRTNPVAVREFLQQATRARRPAVRQAALTALGELNDPRAIPVLATFAEGRDADNPEVKAAREAIKTLQAHRPPSLELGALRRQVRELRDTQRQLRETLNALRQQLDSREKEK